MNYEKNINYILLRLVKFFAITPPKIYSSLKGPESLFPFCGNPNKSNLVKY